ILDMDGPRPSVSQTSSDTIEVETADSALAETVEPGSSRSTGFDLWLNTIPQQGSETVRTEEAMFASLACLTLTE
ncbi:RNA methyltransferase, partial [Klebsiella pneumoniae]|uniref:RNA methyltransferase n=1 Tax=Klebsiella pneumoniae TaxID=573 RepID=UPI001C6018D2